MQCGKCQEIFELKSTPSKLYWMSEIDELNDKVDKLIAELGYEFLQSNGISYIEIENTKSFFVKNSELINEKFTQMESEAIRLHVEYPGESFTFQSILGAKTLRRYLNLIEDNVFFDIINNASLTSYFQPIVNAKDRTIYGYEALIRGVKDDGSLMFPDVLFEKSERNDLNFKLDRMCRESALKTAATKKIKQKIFINFLPTSVYDPEFCLRSTVKWAKQLEFDPKNIIFEVVETESVKDKKHLINILEYYKKEGFSIALDDVGEGYSSLNMLVDIRPDIIKVDRNIITNIDTDSLKQSTYRALYNLAHENKIAVLAEGVETKEELSMIESIGVDYLQGYYFGKPNAEPLRRIHRAI